MAFVDKGEVFETPDTETTSIITGVVTPVGVEESKNDDIDTADVDVNASRQKFAKASATKNTTSVFIANNIHDLSSLQKEFQRFETPLQTLHRLQGEVDSFSEQLKTAKEEGGTSDQSFDQGVSVGDMLNQLGALQEQLVQLSPGAKDRTNAVSTAGGESAVLQASLSRTLKESVGKIGAIKASTPASSDGDKAQQCVTYELYGSEQNTDVVRAADLESRLAKVEAALYGNTLGSGSSVSGRSLEGILGELERKIELLDQRKLDLLKVKVSNANQEIDAFNKKRAEANQGAEDRENVKKIEGLYALYAKWRDVSTSLPSLVTRLTALQDVHQRSVSFADSVSTLQSEQQAINHLLQEDKGSLEQVQVTFNENLSTIQANMEALDARISKLAA